MRACFRIPNAFRTCFKVAAIALPFAIFGYITIAAQNTQQFDRDAILNHLNTVITWYRDCTNKVQPVGLPSDAIYQNNARSVAAEAVRLAFQSARAEAALISSPDQGKATNPNTASGGNQPDLTQMQARIAAEIDDLQSKLDALNKQIAAASPNKRVSLIAERDKLEGALTLDKAVQDAIQKMATFVETNNDASSEGLLGSINQLARSVPEMWGNTSSQKVTPPPSASTSQSSGATSAGLIGQALALFSEVQSMHQVDQMITETEHVRQTAENLRKPLRDTLSATMQRGRELASRAESGTPGQSALQSAQNVQREFQDLTAKFKQLSDAALPLSQEIVVIEQSRANFQEWRKSIGLKSRNDLRALAVRVIGITLALAALMVVSEIWRRLTFRYIHDARRKRQFLLMRRFVMGFLTGIVLILGFVSEFSSLATFAGFATAGIAVALQAVLLSVAAYFFVMGRYGIRVSDRISVAGVTGDVIDIGLTRLYMMELAGTGIDLYPTGRIVVFSNSVLFQAGTPLFKQLPGTEYTWHEVAVGLAATGNYKIVQDKISSAVNSVYEQYRTVLERQHGDVERQYEVQITAPEPESKLQFTDAGLEFVLRYPVDIRKASEIDDRITRKLLEVINGDPELRAAVTGSPKIRAAVKG
jgi:Mechanosensitive ion channel